MFRTRRLRQTENLRRLRKETHLHIDDFIYPLFVVPGEGIKEEISSLKDQFHLSVDMLEDEIAEITDLGLKYVMLFGIPESKDELGTSGYIENGTTQRAIKKIKDINPEIIVVTDVCMCEYTTHGHCGILDENGYVDNDVTLGYLSKIALSHARAGADIICPSDMMDGRVEAIRKTLDENGFVNTPILSHSSKFASSYYGPFREACDSAPSFGDRRGYQLDFHNGREAITEGELDMMEGADILMVKPALAYLDVVRAYRENFNLPIAVYNVSGEYQMLVNAVDSGVVCEDIIYESLIAMKRAGADIIVSYFAKYAAKKIQNGEWI